MRTLLALVALLVAPTFAAAAAAQQTTTVIAWDYAGTPAATAQAYQHTLSVDGVVQAGAVACTGAPTATCKQVVPALSPGQHQLTVSAVAAGVERATVVTANPANGPTQQSNVRVSVTVTVTVP